MVYSDGRSADHTKRSREEMQQFDRPKFKALIHYVISRCPPESLGRTKLNKAGFYADMLSYLQFGRPMTGETYRKQDHGPVADHLQSSLRELIGEGKMQESLVHHYGFAKYDYRSTVEPDLSRISAEEKALIDEVADFVCLQNTAKSISEFSHTEAWRSARSGEELPYFAASELLDTEVDEGDVAWAHGELGRLETERPKYRALHGQSLGAVCSELLAASRRSPA